MDWRTIPTDLHYETGGAEVALLSGGEIIETCPIKDFFFEDGIGEADAYSIAASLASTGSSRFNGLEVKLSE